MCNELVRGALKCSQVAAAVDYESVNCEYRALMAVSERAEKVRLGNCT